MTGSVERGREDVLLDVRGGRLEPEISSPGVDLAEGSESIPLVDLALQHAFIAGSVDRGWAHVVDRGSFVLGDEVRSFEQAYAAFCGVRHCLGVGSGTDALEFVLRAVDVGTGDEVIVPTNSFIASASAVARTGATPILVDVDPDSLLIDPEEVASRRTSKTRAVVAVHLFGQMAPMELLHEAVDEDVLLIEDAAQAHGAKRHGIEAGRYGAAAATSFYPGKNLGAYGDAGAALTDDGRIARRVATLRDHGSETKYQHPVLGFNSRLDTLQAVVLSAKLRFLQAWNRQRQDAAARYTELLAGADGIVPPSILRGNEHVWHLYVVRVPRRDLVLERLHEAGIGAGIHYPTPIHLQGAFGSLGHRIGDFPVAERASEEILSLPIYPGITPAQQERVVAELVGALR